MSINPKSVQKREIECKNVKLRAKKCKCAKTEKLKMIDSYVELGQTKWRTKLNEH